MGWWSIDTEHDLAIGDTVVDGFTRKLQELVEARHQRGATPPTLAVLLAGIADALRRKTAMWCGPEEDTPFAELCARVEHDDESIEDVFQDPVADPEIADKMLDAFEDCAMIYEDEIERRPHRSELIAVVEFTLSASPEDYLDIAAGSHLLDITVVAPGGAVRRSF